MSSLGRGREGCVERDRDEVDMGRDKRVGWREGEKEVQEKGGSGVGRQWG